MPHKVHPVPGVFLAGVPAVVTEVATRKEADELVASGAFAHTAPRRRAATSSRPAAARRRARPKRRPCCCACGAA